MSRASQENGGMRIGNENQIRRSYSAISETPAMMRGWAGEPGSVILFTGGDKHDLYAEHTKLPIT